MANHNPNSEGLKMMYGGAGSWNFPPLQIGVCALCQEKLRVIGKTHMCTACRAVYIKQDNGLLNYLGKTNERCKETG